MSKKTKAQVLQGRRATEDLFIEEMDWTVTLRPLTEGQRHQLEAMSVRGQEVRAKQEVKIGESEEDGEPADRFAQDQEISLDLEKVVLAAYDARVQAAAWAIVDDEPWTTEDVKAIPEPGVVDRIAAKVFEMSKVDLEDVSTFRRGS